MKNKKTLITMLAIGLVKMTFAQLFVDVSGGYAYKLGQQEVATSFEETSSSTLTEYNYSQVRGSYGQGFNVGLNVGYFFNGSIGAELRSDYLFSSAITATTSSNSDWGGTQYSSESTSDFRASMFRLTPSIVIKADNEKISPYAKLGVVLGFGSVEMTGDYSNSDGDVEEITIVQDGNMAIGASAELGMLIPINDYLSFIGGVQVVGMNYAPASMRITKYTVNGQDVLAEMYPIESDVQYVDNISVSSASPPNSQNPDKRLQEWLPFSSVGINVGLRFSL